jgi:hypothetical protein
MATTHPVRRVAVIGTGVIGASWTALFLAKGLEVSATDVAPNAETALKRFIEAAWPALDRLGLTPGASQSKLTFTADLATAVRGADFVQENGPERIEFKQKLYGQLDELLPPDVVIASSSSGLTMSEIQAGCASHPERCVIGHPFNPPHLVPLVEIVGGAKTSEATIERTTEFYSGVGWAADTAGLNLAAVGVEFDPRNFVKVDQYLCTSKPHFVAAGERHRPPDAGPASAAGWVCGGHQCRPRPHDAATRGRRQPHRQLHGTGIHTGRPHRSQGARQPRRSNRDQPFDTTTRTIFDGRTFGFCKLIADRATAKILGCHVIGERAVDIAAAITSAARMQVDELARIPRLSDLRRDSAQCGDHRRPPAQPHAGLAGATVRQHRPLGPQKRSSSK